MPTEESVLNSFLLNSELADNLTLKQFINLFPTAYRKESLIKTLYREFQLERNRIRETIKENIVEECKKPEQWGNLDNGIMEIDDDDDMDDHDEVDDNRITLEQAIETLTVAEKRMSREINKMDEDCKRFFEKIENINNELNDVVYGRIPKGGFGQEDDIERLKLLTISCDEVLISSKNR